MIKIKDVVTGNVINDFCYQFLIIPNKIFISTSYICGFNFNLKTK